MEGYSFRINSRIVWILTITSFLSFLTGISFKIFEEPLSDSLSLTGFVVSFTAWLLIFADMLSHRFYHRIFWIISLFLFPPITPLIYLIQRNRLIRLEQGFSLKQ